MQFRILGPLEVADGDCLVSLAAAQRSLLALLLLSANEVVSADRLIEELWGEEAPESGRTALQVRVSQLRKALDGAGGRIATRAPGYLLRVDRDELDLYCFERLVSEADAAEPAEAAAKLREALGLWRGAPLDDLSYASFAQPAIRQLEELRLAALEKRIEAALELGRQAELVGELEMLVEEHPLREHLHAQLMLALYRCGRQADALAAYQNARRVLVEQLALEPSAPLRQLERAILRQEASLDLEATIAARAPSVAAGSESSRQGPREDRNVPHNLPAQVSSFVGRERELSELRQLLSRARVITLTGAGGVGKTRLALQLAASMLDGSGRRGLVCRSRAADGRDAGRREAGGGAWSPGAVGTIAAAVADRRVRGPTGTRDPGQLRARDRRGGQCRRPVGARLSEDDHSRDQPRAARDRRRASISRPLAVRPAGRRRSRAPARVRRGPAVR